MGSRSPHLQVTIFATTVKHTLKIITSWLNKNFRQEEVTGVATHVHRISSFDSSLVFLIICMSFVIGFLLLNVKRILSQNRRVFWFFSQNFSRIWQRLYFWKSRSLSDLRAFFCHFELKFWLEKFSLENCWKLAKDQLSMSDYRLAAVWKKTLSEILPLGYFNSILLHTMYYLNVNLPKLARL